MTLATSENRDSRKKRLAIVGGGPSALVAAFHLTQKEPEAYDITVYEMSWRLGGKTVSGRGEHGRIEEHGLHILFGCYHNVFATMIDCYDEMSEKRLVDPAEHRLQHFYDAVAPHHFGVIGDDRKDPWEPILLEFPSNRGVPGDPPLPTTFDLFSTLFQVLWMVLVSPRSLRHLHRILPWLFDFRSRWQARDFNKRARSGMQRRARDRRSLGGDRLSRAILASVKHALDGRTLLGKLTLSCTKIAQKSCYPFRNRLPGFLARPWTTLDFVQALVRGLIEDRVVLPGGFESIDKYDLRGWLFRKGAAQETLASPWIRVIYDAAFSYPEGGVKPSSHQCQPGEMEGESVAAGAALRALMLMMLTYKGAFYNKMLAGMGDIIHVPLYLVLKRRGVKFRFFHRLTDLKPVHTASGDYVIDEVVLDALPQADDYEPLVQVKDLKCWPSTPRLEQIREEHRARARSAESYAGYEGAGNELKLRRGAHFDLVVLGTPVACLPYVCPSLLALDQQRSDAPKPSLSDQFQIDTVQTIAVQLWLKPTLRGLGWRDPSPLLSLFLDPLNTWCDMTHLEPCEDWPSHLRAQNVSYFCGALPHEHAFPRPGELAKASAVQRAIEQQVYAVTRKFVQEQIHQLLPTAHAPAGFNYGLLVDPNNGKDDARLQAAYLRANYEPHALCTLALPGKTQFRMKTDATGYSNLFVTGDWIDNNVHLACVEGAFQSGIRTARAICNHYGGPVDDYVIAAEGLMNLPVATDQAAPPTRQPTR
jgi:uncharacterized protein with NAD-binding domain and iron-sulfur cluster